MTEERTTPLRERMIEDMRIRGLGHQSQRAHIRAVKDFAGFLGRSPDTATTEELRSYQLHMTDKVVGRSREYSCLFVRQLWPMSRKPNSLQRDCLSNR